MRVDCLVENIGKHTSLLSKIIPVHAQIPIFSNILIEANENGLFISATDLELGVRIKIPAKIETTGATTVPGKQFIEIINSLPKDKVSFFLEKDIFIIKSRGNTIHLQTIPKDEFPALFEQKGEKKAVFKPDELKEIFSKVLFAVSIDDSRPVLTGILIIQGKGELDIVATDGYRLSLKKTIKNIFEKEGEKMVLSSRLVNEILLLKPEKNEISMFVLAKSNQLLFEAEDIFIVGRIIEGEFPPYEKVIPKTSNTKISIDKEELLQNLRLSSIFARESANIIHFKTEGKNLKVFSKASGVGEGEFTMDIEKDGEDNEIAFNVKFVLDLLKNIDEDKMEIELNSALEPALFKTPKDKDFLHVIMPVRVQE